MSNDITTALTPEGFENNKRNASQPPAVEPWMEAAAREVNKALGRTHYVNIARIIAQHAPDAGDTRRLDWIASRKSTELVCFYEAGWAIINPAGGDLLHDKNIHDLREALDVAMRGEEKQP